MDQFLKPYGNDYFYAAHAIMLDRPYVGQKTLDVLRVLDWLASVGHTKSIWRRSGWGTLPAPFAGFTVRAGQASDTQTGAAIRTRRLQRAKRTTGHFPRCCRMC